MQLETRGLGVGNQSLGLTEVAYQNAVAYAKDRIQMRSLSGTKAKDKEADPIIVHPDVRKMLLTAKAYAEGARALQIYCTLLLDKVHSHPDEKVRAESEELVALLTPIVKAFITDNGHTATNACMQVFGGHGFIKEWGMEQYVRDNRINMIYEGTNTIQSLDLLGRKVVMNGGQALAVLGARITQTIEKAAQVEGLAAHAQALGKALNKIAQSTQAAWSTGKPDEALANATPYLQAFGHTVLAWIWLELAVAAQGVKVGGKRASDEAFLQGKLAACDYFFNFELPRIDAWLGVVSRRDMTCAQAQADWF